VTKTHTKKPPTGGIFFYQGKGRKGSCGDLGGKAHTRQRGRHTYYKRERPGHSRAKKIWDATQGGGGRRQEKKNYYLIVFLGTKNRSAGPQEVGTYRSTSHNKNAKKKGNAFARKRKEVRQPISNRKEKREKLRNRDEGGRFLQQGGVHFFPKSRGDKQRLKRKVHSPFKRHRETRGKKVQGAEGGERCGRVLSDGEKSREGRQE